MKGYMAIVTVLVLLVVTGGIAASSTFISIDVNQAETALQKGEQALFFSEACLEEAYLRIVRDPAYSGSTFQLPEGECEVVVALDGQTYSIQALGKDEQYERGVSAEAVLELDRLRVTSWREE